MPANAGTRPRKVLIVHAQRLMLPLLADIVSHAGPARVLAYRSPSARTVRRARPDLVVLDADTPGTRPLEAIVRARRNCAARIVVITRSADPAWHALATALGADRVLGPAANSHDLFTAVRAA